MKNNNKNGLIILGVLAVVVILFATGMLGSLVRANGASDLSPIAGQEYRFLYQINNAEITAFQPNILGIPNSGAPECLGDYSGKKTVQGQVNYVVNERKCDTGALVKMFKTSNVAILYKCGYDGKATSTSGGDIVISFTPQQEDIGNCFSIKTDLLVPLVIGSTPTVERNSSAPDLYQSFTLQVIPASRCVAGTVKCIKNTGTTNSNTYQLENCSGSDWGYSQNCDAGCNDAGTACKNACPAGKNYCINGNMAYDKCNADGTAVDTTYAYHYVSCSNTQVCVDNANSAGALCETPTPSGTTNGTTPTVDKVCQIKCTNGCFNTSADGLNLDCKPSPTPITPTCSDAQIAALNLNVTKGYTVDSSICAIRQQTPAEFCAANPTETACSGTKSDILSQLTAFLNQYGLYLAGGIVALGAVWILTEKKK